MIKVMELKLRVEITKLSNFGQITVSSLAYKSWVHPGRILDGGQDKHRDLLLRTAGGADLLSLLCDLRFGANFASVHR